MPARIVRVLARTQSAGRPGQPHPGDRQPLRVLHVVVLGDADGLERAVQSLCIGLRRREHDVHLAAASDTAEVLEQFQAPLAAAGAHVHPIILPPRAFLRERRAFAELAAAVEPNVVHTHGCLADILAGWAARAALPTVTTLYGFTGGTWKHRLYERLQRMSLAEFDGVAAVSPSLAKQLASRVAAERLRVIPSAWLEPEAPLGRAAARRALALPGDQHHVIGWAGRLCRANGLDLALKALALLADLPARLALVGDGPERAEYEKLAAHLDVAGRVHWCGRMPDARRLFGGFDAFLFSSRTEYTPMVLLEAMAARTPIVAAAVGGVPDLLPRGTALVVPPENPEALAHALRNVFSCPRHATARASAARTRLLTEYAPQHWVDAYEALYREVSRKLP